jgi:hypothetical protein
MTLKFQLPIETVHHDEIDSITLKDLEILETKQTNQTSEANEEESQKTVNQSKNNSKNNETEKTSCLFDVLYNPTNEVDELIKEPLMKYYTTDVSFLTQTQEFIKNSSSFEHISRDLLISSYDSFKTLSNQKDFYSKYQYIQFKMFRKLNQNPHFMQMLSFYNMFSPIITLVTPFIILILPFFLIKMQGVKLTFSAYFSSIKLLLKNHAVGKLLNSFANVSWEKRVYLIITVIFYIMQVYQNALSCYNFTKNMKHIHNHLFELRDYLEHSCRVINHTEGITQKCNLNCYHAFQKNNNDCSLVLRKLKQDLDEISPLKISISKAAQIGNVMRLYYKIKNDPTVINAINYSFNLHSYLNAMLIISKNNKLNNTTYNIPSEVKNNKKENKNNKKENKKDNKKENKWSITSMGYPHNINKSCVFNDVKLTKPIILTGPNASGKTTLLKSAILNTMLSQQIGKGFFKKLNMTPYNKFHCYLDVPDTAGRDSLFQSEARRCLEIIKSVEKSNVRSFCIFDELYSGTNPTEAIASAYAFTKYLSKIKNTDFMLTTHFYKLCKLCKTNKTEVVNNQMGWETIDKYNENDNKNDNKNVDVDNSNFKFTYKMKKGISDLRGGVRVLKQLNYPSIVINDATNILK